MNAKGQAAVMDALYLLLIVTTLSVFLFVFSVRYGSNTTNYLQAQYARDYTSSALKTLLYSSVNVAPAASDPQFDYLLVVAKQDYFSQNSGELNVEKKELVRTNLKKVMKPIAPSFDYFFYWYTQDRKTVMAYLFASEFPSDSGFTCGTASNPRAFDKSQINQFGRVEYYCHPDLLGPVADLTQANSSLDSEAIASHIQALLQAVGESAQSSAGIRLLQSRGSDVESVASKVDLIIWPSTCIPQSVLTNLRCELVPILPV